MTHPETIRATLARLWDTDATAYDMAWAILKAVDIENDDLEVEVESVISRALTARELVDLAKVAAEVAKLLPAMELKPEAPKPLPLCEAICKDFDLDFPEVRPAGEELYIEVSKAKLIIRKHFGAMMVEEVARTIEGPNWAWPLLSGRDRADRMLEAQAVMRLLRKE